MDSIQTMEQRKCLQVKISLKCVSRETLVYGSTIGWCLPNPLKYKKKNHCNSRKVCVQCNQFVPIEILHFWLVQFMCESVP